MITRKQLYKYVCKTYNCSYENVYKDTEHIDAKIYLACSVFKLTDNQALKVLGAWCLPPVGFGGWNTVVKDLEKHNLYKAFSIICYYYDINTETQYKTYEKVEREYKKGLIKIW